MELPDAYIVTLPPFLKTIALLSFVFPVRYRTKTSAVHKGKITKTTIRRYRVYRGVVSDVD